MNLLSQRNVTPTANDNSVAQVQFLRSSLHTIDEESVGGIVILDRPCVATMLTDNLRMDTRYIEEHALFFCVVFWRVFHWNADVTFVSAAPEQ